MDLVGIVAGLTAPASGKKIGRTTPGLQFQTPCLGKFGYVSSLIAHYSPSWPLLPVKSPLTASNSTSTTTTTTVKTTTTVTVTVEAVDSRRFRQSIDDG